MHPVQEFIQFCDHVRADDDHDCWSMTWLDTVREGRSLVLRLAVDTGLNERPNQIWEVGSHHARGFSLVEFELTDWTLADDHVLLVGPPGAVQSAQFPAPCKRHEDVLWKLYERHRAVAWPWIPFERYINPAILENCLSTGSGVLADGPDRLLREYADVLEKMHRRTLLSLSAAAGPPLGRRQPLLGRRGGQVVGVDPGRLVVHRRDGFFRESGRVGRRGMRETEYECECEYE